MPHYSIKSLSSLLIHCCLFHSGHFDFIALKTTLFYLTVLVSHANKQTCTIAVHNKHSVINWSKLRLECLSVIFESCTAEQHGIITRKECPCYIHLLECTVQRFHLKNVKSWVLLTKHFSHSNDKKIFSVTMAPLGCRTKQARLTRLCFMSAMLSVLLSYYSASIHI